MTNGKIKSVIVTGGSGGIGRAVAKRLAQDGFAVTVHYAGNSETAQEVVKEITSSGGTAIALKGNVSVVADVEYIFRETTKVFGRLDAVVHSAGIMPLFPISEGDVETFDKVISTNLRGAFLVLSQATKHLTEGGRIVAFSSSVLAKSFPNYGAYIASKSGVEGLVHVLANELRGRNITVNAVAPGPTATELFYDGKTEAQIENFKKLTPLERLGQPEDVASMVSFIVGPEGGWINSQVLRVNGGFA